MSLADDVKAVGGIRAYSRATCIPYTTVHKRLAAEQRRAERTAPVARLRAPSAARRSLPARGKVKTYILTSAQNNTGLHEACWLNLQALAEHDDAEIIVAAFTYCKPAAQLGAKRKTAKERGYQAEVWDERLEPYFVDQRVELAPGLAWCGELQILPTAVNPISGLESYTARDSAIIPHPKFAVESVAAPKGKGAKLIYTTGAVTLRNYIQKKTGQKAEFHHGYGALLVEVCSDGSWFVRQLCADSEGVIYDLARKVDGGRVTHGHRPAALIWGDVHVRTLEADVRALQWGDGGILDTLRPLRQVLHDVLDFRSQNHHDRDDPWRTYDKHAAGGTSVAAELAEAADFLTEAGRSWCETAIVRSNHDEALCRWLRETDARDDPQNAVFWLRANLARYEGGPALDPIEWAFQQTRRKFTRVRFLRRDEDYSAQGIKLDMHGDQGANGARFSPTSGARFGFKYFVGHSHSAWWRDGGTGVGLSAALDQGYNEGLSSWSRTHGLVYPNGKRALFTVWRGRWHGRDVA
jgi:hypothetical protein